MTLHSMRSIFAGPAVLFVVAVCGGAARVGAQSDDARPFHVVAFTTGATAMDVSALNTQLSAARFAGLSNGGVTYGATGHYAFGRALLGADIARTIYGNEWLDNGRSDELNAMEFVGNASYAIVSTREWNVYPTLGVGLGKFDVTLRDRNVAGGTTTATPTFAEVAQNPGQSTTLSGSHLLFNVGGGVDYLITRSALGTAGVVFGARAGYSLSPHNTTWTSGGRTVIAGPDASSGGPFVRVVIGFGGR